jgi:hypothetical protein
MVTVFTHGESRVEVSVARPGGEEGVGGGALDVTAAVAWVAAALELPADQILARRVRHRARVARGRGARAAPRTMHASVVGQLQEIRWHDDGQ